MEGVLDCTVTAQVGEGEALALNEASLVKIQGSEGDSSNSFFVVIILNFFKLWEIFIDYLLDLFLRVAFLWVRGTQGAG